MSRQLPYEKTFHLRDRQRGTVTMLLDPPAQTSRPTAPIVPVLPPPPEPDVQPLLVDVKDFATRIDLNVQGPNPANEYVEHQMEGPPFPNEYTITRNRDIQLGLRGKTKLLYRGGTVENQYPLQADAQSAQTNTTLILDCDPERRQSLCAVAPGSSVWVPPSAAVDQEATIARFGEEATEEGRLPSEGLLAWARSLDEGKRRVWAETSRVRVGRDGRATFRAPEGPARLSLASEWSYEPWRSDASSYIFTEGETPFDDDVGPPSFGVNRRSAVRLEILESPQIHRVVTRWVASYMLRFSWWLTVINLPTVRSFSLRSPFWPRFWTPAGRVQGNGFVDDTYSARIRNTQAYAQAIRSDLDAGGVFIFLGRFAGRFGVYVRDFDRHALCAEIRQTYPDGTRRDLRVFRRHLIERENYLLHVAGLFVPGEITPYVGSEFEYGDPLYTSGIADGF